LFIEGKVRGAGDEIMQGDRSLAKALCATVPCSCFLTRRGAEGAEAQRQEK